jgi:hypothetical protein
MADGTIRLRKYINGQKRWAWFGFGEQQGNGRIFKLKKRMGMGI